MPHLNLLHSLAHVRCRQLRQLRFRWVKPCDSCVDQQNLFANFLQVGTKRVRNVPGAAAGSGSDIEGGAASGGEMSESGRNKKLKLNPPAAASQNGTPQGSRSGSPAPLGGKGVAGSRASSPECGAAMKGRFDLELWIGGFSNTGILIISCTPQANNPESQPPGQGASKVSPLQRRFMLLFPRPAFLAATCSRSSVPASASRKKTIVGSSPLSRTLVFTERRTACCGLAF